MKKRDWYLFIIILSNFMDGLFYSLIFLIREFLKIVYEQARRTHADVIVHSFAHLHTALRTEGNMLDMNSAVSWVQAAMGSVT